MSAQVGYSRLAVFETQRIAAKCTQAAPAMAMLTMRVTDAQTSP